MKKKMNVMISALKNVSSMTNYSDVEKKKDDE